MHILAKSNFFITLHNEVLIQIVDIRGDECFVVEQVCVFKTLEKQQIAI